jgi:hypothetical protein
MTGERYQDLPPAKRRRLIFRAVLRSVVVATLLVVLTMCFRWTAGGIPTSRCVC